MALPESVTVTNYSWGQKIIIGSTTVTFDYPFQIRGSARIGLEVAGTQGSGTTILQASVSGANFTTLGMQDAAGTVTLTTAIVIGCFSVPLVHTGYQTYNLKYTGSSSTLSHGISISYLG